MKILAISTSTPRGSAALVRDGEVLAAVVYVDLQGHAERIFAAIDAVLAQAGERRGAIEGLSCDVGPGSFTGVRVGVASAKGIALGLGVPLAGVVSLQAMAAAAFAGGAAGPGDVVIAAIDAKKSEVFAAAYDAAGAELLAPCARLLGPEAFVLAERGSAGGRVVVVGEVAAGIALPAGAQLRRGDALDLPDAAWVGRLATARGFTMGARPPSLWTSGDAVEPLYVRAPDVTRPRLGGLGAEPPS